MVWFGEVRRRIKCIQVDEKLRSQDTQSKKKTFNTLNDLSPVTISEVYKLP